CGHVTVSVQSNATPEHTAGTIAFVRGGDIWVSKIGSDSSKRLTTDGRNRAPQWSPSGNWIAFLKGEAEGWLVRFDGSDAHVIGATTEFRWSPASDRLAYTSGTPSAPHGLMVVDAG